YPPQTSLRFQLSLVHDRNPFGLSQICDPGAACGQRAGINSPARFGEMTLATQNFRRYDAPRSEPVGCFQHPGIDGMKIHEYQAKQLLVEAGVPVPKGIVARTAEEAARAFIDLGGPVAVVKSQIHAGGRGKGTFKEHPEQRGVVLVKSGSEARDNAGRILGSTLVTKQTGPEGKKVNIVYVEAGCDKVPGIVLRVFLD